jgi:hypothetical protein
VKRAPEGRRRELAELGEKPAEFTVWTSSSLLFFADYEDGLLVSAAGPTAHGQGRNRQFNADHAEHAEKRGYFNSNCKGFGLFYWRESLSRQDNEADAVSASSPRHLRDPR